MAGLGGWGFEMALMPGGMLNPTSRPGTVEFTSAVPSTRPCCGPYYPGRPTTSSSLKPLSRCSSKKGNRPASGNMPPSGHRPMSGNQMIGGNWLKNRGFRGNAGTLLGELQPVKHNEPSGLAVYASTDAKQLRPRRPQDIVRKELVRHAVDGFAPVPINLSEDEEKLLEIRRRTACMRKRTLELMERADAADLQYSEDFALRLPSVPVMASAYSASSAPASPEDNVAFASSSRVSGTAAVPTTAATSKEAKEAACRLAKKAGSASSIGPALPGSALEFPPEIQPFEGGFPADEPTEDEVVLPNVPNSSTRIIREKVNSRAKSAKTGEDSPRSVPRKTQSREAVKEKRPARKVTKERGFQNKSKSRLSRGAQVGPNPGETKLHEMSNKIVVQNREHLAMVCIYEHSATHNLHIQVQLMTRGKRGEVLDMYIDSQNVDDLLHHAMLMGDQEEEVNQSQGHRGSQSSIARCGVTPSAASDDVAPNSMELLGQLVEIVHEQPHTSARPALQLQIIGWVDPAIRHQQGQQEVADDLGSLFRMMRST